MDAIGKAIERRSLLLLVMESTRPNMATPWNSVSAMHRRRRCRA